MGTGLRIFHALNLCTFLVAGVGCYSPKSANFKKIDTQETYKLREADRAKLASVGCRLEKASLVCDPIEPKLIQNQDSLESMLTTRAQMERRKQVLDQVHDSIERDVRSNKMGTFGRLDAQYIQTSIAVQTSVLVGRAATQDTEILKERGYHEVLGYRCEGLYLSMGQPQKIQETILFSKTKDFSKEMKPQGASDFRGLLRLEAGGGLLSWGHVDVIGGGPGLPAKLQRSVSVKGGEFVFSQEDSSGVNLACTKMRNSGTSSQVSDRPVARRQLKCTSNSKLTDGQTGPQGLETGLNAELTVNSTDESKVIELGRNEYLGMGDDLFAGQPLAKLRYSFRLTSDKGLLIFEGYDRQSQQVLSRVTTSNSTQEIRLSVEDVDGNYVRILCGEEFPPGK